MFLTLIGITIKMSSWQLYSWNDQTWWVDKHKDNYYFSKFIKTFGTLNTTAKATTVADFSCLIAYGWSQLLQGHVGIKDLASRLQGMPQAITIVYDGSNEGGASEKRVEVMLQTLRAYFGQDQKVMMLSQNRLLCDKLPKLVRWHHGFLLDLQAAAAGEALDFTGSARFLALGGCCRSVKQTAFCLLQEGGYLDYNEVMNWSLGRVMMEYATCWRTPSYLTNDIIGSIVKAEYPALHKRLPKRLDDIVDPGAKRGTIGFSRGLMSMGRVQLVIESELTSHLQRVTEKTLKALAAGVPFIVVGNHKSLAYLHQMGFKTFAECGLDEAYDDEADHVKRLLAALHQLDKLRALSDDMFAAFLSGCQEVCNYNRTRMSNLSFHENFGKGIFKDT